jgi:hypothetical protein
MHGRGHPLDGLEKKVDTGFQEIGETTHGIITMISERFDAVERRLDRIDKGYGYRIAHLERDMADLKT